MHNFFPSLKLDIVNVYQVNATQICTQWVQFKKQTSVMYTIGLHRRRIQHTKKKEDILFKIRLA